MKSSIKTTFARGEYSEAANHDGSIVFAFFDGRTGGPAVRTFQDENARDLWWNVNGPSKFGLARKLPAYWARWAHFLSLVPALAPDLQKHMEDVAADAHDTTIGMGDAITEPYITEEATEEEPAGMPATRLISVPTEAQAALEALEAELAEIHRLMEEVQAGEAKAGWDRNA